MTIFFYRLLYNSVLSTVSSCSQLLCSCYWSTGFCSQFSLIILSCFNLHLSRDLPCLLFFTLKIMKHSHKVLFSLNDILLSYQLYKINDNHLEKKNSKFNVRNSRFCHFQVYQILTTLLSHLKL